MGGAAGCVTKRSGELDCRMAHAGKVLTDEVGGLSFCNRWGPHELAGNFPRHRHGGHLRFVPRGSSTLARRARGPGDEKSTRSIGMTMPGGTRISRSALLTLRRLRGAPPTRSGQCRVLPGIAGVAFSELTLPPQPCRRRMQWAWEHGERILHGRAGALSTGAIAGITDRLGNYFHLEIDTITAGVSGNSRQIHGSISARTNWLGTLHACHPFPECPQLSWR